MYLSSVLPPAPSTCKSGLANTAGAPRRAQMHETSAYRIHEYRQCVMGILFRSAVFPVIGTHPGESSSEQESMYRDASLVACLTRVVLTQFCYEISLLPFTCWFPRHQVVALQLLVVVAVSSTRPAAAVETVQKCDSRQTQSLVVSFLPISYFRFSPLVLLVPTPHLFPPSPILAIAPSQKPPSPQGIHCLCHYCTGK